METEVFLKLWDIVGSEKRGTKAILPISRTTWLDGVRAGRFPKPVKVGPRSVFWKKSEIDKLMQELAGDTVVTR